MSQEKNGENNNNCDIDELDIQKISLFFVDSLFKENLQKFKPKDKIKSKVTEFNSQSSNQSNKNNHKSTSKADQIPPPSSNQETKKTSKKKIKNQTENNKIGAAAKETISKNNKNKETKEKTSKSKTKNNKINNPNNSFKEKKLNYNMSLQNISRTKKVINTNNISNNNKPNANGKIVYRRKKTFSSLSKNYKAKKESEKEKKIYQEKVRLLENRIMALKYHQDEIHRKKLYNDVRQTYLDLKKKEKSDLKQTLISNDIDKKKELDLKRKQIRDQKNSLNKYLKESRENDKITKMEDYQNFQKERKVILARISQNNSQYENYGKENISKIKKEREQVKQSGLKKQKSLGKKIDNYYYETCEDNKHETNNLKNKLKKLEKLEIKYMNSLNKARKDMFGNNLEGKVLFKREVIPVQKLDLDKQFEIMPYSINIKDSNKKNNKTTNMSVDITNKININENKNEKINSKDTKK
jgi:hypothetical protein